MSLNDIRRSLSITLDDSKKEQRDLPQFEYRRICKMSKTDNKMKIEIMQEMPAELANDPHFRKRLMDKVMSLPEFRKMLVKMVVKELAD